MRMWIPSLALVVALGTLSGGASAFPPKQAAKRSAPAGAGSVRRTVAPKRVDGERVQIVRTGAPEVGRDGKIIRAFTGVR